MFGELNSNRLLDIWPSINSIPYTSKNVRIDLEKYPICSKHNDIHDFFTFIKCVATHRVSFDNAIKSLIVISEVNRYRMISIF